MLPEGGGNRTFLHCTWCCGAAQGLAPFAHLSPSPLLPGSSGSGFLLLFFPDPISLAARNSRMLLLGGCCLIGPNPLNLEVRKHSQREARTGPRVQRVHASVSTRIWAPGSFPLNSYCLFLCERFSPRCPIGLSLAS